MHSSPTPEERRDRLVFYPVAAVGGLFCVTTLATIAAAFSNPPSPVATWLNRHATALLLWETALLVGIALLAMTLDRLRTLKRRQAASKADDPPASSPPPGAGGNRVG